MNTKGHIDNKPGLPFFGPAGFDRKIHVRIRYKFMLFALAILAGIGFIGYSVYKSNQNLRNSEQLVQHTEKVIYQTRNILSTANVIETASRGFVITNDTEFLEPLYDAEKTTFADVDRLKELTQDNPVQQKRVDSLNFYMHKRVDFSFQTIKLENRHGTDSAIGYISTKQAKRYTDHIRRITNVIQKEEDHLLKVREEINEASAAAYNRLSFGIFILMVVFTILFLIAGANYLLQNKEKEKRAGELAIANKELVFQNEEKKKRAAELIIANEELIFQNSEKEKRAAELSIANTELKLSDEYLKEHIVGLEEMMFMVSHKVRQPVVHILGISNLLNGLISSPGDLKKSIEYIKQSALTLDHFTREITDFMSRLEQKAKK